MRFSQLATITSGTPILYTDRNITHIATDTRSLSGTDGEVFVALRGTRDGHQYVASGYEVGVRNFILEKAPPPTLPEANIILVPDALKALQLIAATHRQQYRIPVVGITGSNGKTTVKEWLSTLLTQQFYVVKSPKSYNSQIGVSLSVMELNASHEMAVFEAGISKAGEMATLQSIIQPTLGIFTNLGEAHDDGFSDKSTKLSEKLSLFQTTRKVIYRTDTPYVSQLEEELVSEKVSWSLDGQATYQVKWPSHGIEINNTVFHTRLFHPTQLENLTHAIIAAIELGLSTYNIQQGINLIQDVPMRLELKKGINGCYILDDSYNNDEAGLRVAIHYFNTQKQHPTRTLILSDLLHSAKKNEVLYKEINELIRKSGINRLIGIGERISAQRDTFSIPANFYSSTDDFLKNPPSFENEMILVKGARDFRLERVVKLLEARKHGTVLEVNFEALLHNLNQYRNLLKPTTKLMVMVKANAYGSGILEVANFLQHQQVDMLGVAYVDEAISLRNNGINVPIMIMNPYIDSYHEFERYDLQAEIYSLHHLKRLIKDTTQPPAIHIKIDSGMHRLGFAPDDLEELATYLRTHTKLQVVGIFTHFSSADDPTHDSYTLSQAQAFDKAYDQLSNVLGYTPIKHACNSAALVRWPQYHFDMVRLGVGLHGFDPTGNLSLRFTSRFKTVVSQIQQVAAGATIGYGRAGKVEEPSRIAILPVGYEDGYSRHFGNGVAYVQIGEHLCPTIGNVCMDMVMVNVSGTRVQEGDEALLFGANPTIQDLARWQGTIPYEILTSISNRVKRVFTSE